MTAHRFFLAGGDPPAEESFIVYGVFRNEILFCSHFFEHYRRLGARKFVILDDNSDDGTLDYLLEQPDCCVLRSSHSFSDRIDGVRAPVWWKSEIPKHFPSATGWAVCVDADEFLELPVGCRSISGLLRTIGEATAIPAVMVDFYPPSLQSLATPFDGRGLLDAYPLFDAAEYWDWPWYRRQPRVRYGGVLERLYAEIGARPPYILKMPIVRWSKGVRYEDSHHAAGVLLSDVPLAIMHFKLTHMLGAKIDHALSTRGYWRQSANYEALDRILRSGAALMSERSQRHDSSQASLAERIAPRSDPKWFRRMIRRIAPGLMKTGRSRPPKFLASKSRRSA